jgi:hypothetical protein
MDAPMGTAIAVQAKRNAGTIFFIVFPSGLWVAAA